MNALYTTKVTATGGRHGQIRSEDGLLNMKLRLGSLSTALAVRARIERRRFLMP